MINLILFGSFFVMLFLNIPICVSLGMSSFFAMLYFGDKLSVIPTNVYNSMAKFLLLAIPFFVLSGNIMAKHDVFSASQPVLQDNYRVHFQICSGRSLYRLNQHFSIQIESRSWSWICRSSALSASLSV